MRNLTEDQILSIVLPAGAGAIALSLCVGYWLSPSAGWGVCAVSLFVGSGFAFWYNLVRK